jgi:ABC-type Fe3+-hydroxamate transport system substrate-binding protein
LAQRVVSLVPSITETLLAWGVRPVGVTRFCDAPGVRAVGGTKNPDVAAIASLSPDLVVMDKEENRASDAAALEEKGLRVHVTQVRALDDVVPALAGLAAAVGCADTEPGGASVIRELQRPPRQAVATGLDAAPLCQLPSGASVPAPVSRLTAWIPIWRRPWMSINGATYGSTLLRAAGIDNVCAAAPDTYPTMTLSDAAALHPDVVLAPSEPYPFKERHRAELANVASVVFTDGQDLFWWGSRTPAALARLRELAATLAGR